MAHYPRGIPVKTLHVEEAASTLEHPFNSVTAGERKFLSQIAFERMIAVERKRTERSSEPFLLMLVDAGGDSADQSAVNLLRRVLAVLLASSRETDVVGWYREEVTVGAILTCLVVPDRKTFLDTILSRLRAMLDDQFTEDEFAQIHLSFHFFPDDWGFSGPGSGSDRTLYPDFTKPHNTRCASRVAKRAFDLLASLLALFAGAPLFAIVAAAIKCSSRGPVLFRQTRVGQHGRRFVLYKFRTMFSNCDSAVHREYVTKLIGNRAERMPAAGSGSGYYKLTDDRRVTRIGRFLRRTSLDELPQIINVLFGDMSLVGPRPALPYELDVYQTWHRNRLLAARPGITGLWQVNGRSRVRFDEMVRLDLRYATTWSLWLDIKILLRTPLAVLRGAGAF